MLIIIAGNTTSVTYKGATFSPFLFLVFLFSVIPSNFIVTGAKSSIWYQVLILNVILFSILFTYIFTDGLSIFSPCFFKIYSKKSWIFAIEYDPFGNLNLSFHVGADF